VLEDDVRSRPVEDGAEAANDHGVPEALDKRGLGGEPAEGALVLHEVRADDLGDDERQQMLVPGQVRLVALSAAEELHRQEAGGGGRGRIGPSLRPRKRLVAHSAH
jgi:hypothetical protein